MDLKGLQDMYAGLEPEKTIHRLVSNITFRSSHKTAAACLHDNLVRLRNLTREIFIDGLSEFEASCPALTQVLREHIRSIGDNLERIKAGLQDKDDVVINDSLEGLNAAIDELVEDSEPAIVAIEINKRRGPAGMLVQSVERGAIRSVEDLKQGHDEPFAEEKEETIHTKYQFETMVGPGIIFYGESGERDEAMKMANIGSEGGDMRARLLNRRGEEVKITEEVLKAAAKNTLRGREIIALLLNRQGGEAFITEEVLKVAAKNALQGRKIIEFLLDRQGGEAFITEEVLKAAAKNTLQGRTIIALLLDRRGEEAVITEEVLKVAAKNELQGSDIMELLLYQRGEEVKITEGVLKAAVENKSQGSDILELLISQRGGEVIITVGVLTAAAKNEIQGSDILELLISQRGEEVKITKEVLEAAAKNKLEGGRIIALLNEWEFY